MFVKRGTRGRFYCQRPRVSCTNAYAWLRLDFFLPVMCAADKRDGLVYSWQENEHFYAKPAVRPRAPLWRGTSTRKSDQISLISCVRGHFGVVNVEGLSCAILGSPVSSSPCKYGIGTLVLALHILEQMQSAPTTVLRTHSFGGSVHTSYQDGDTLATTATYLSPRLNTSNKRARPLRRRCSQAASNLVVARSSSKLARA